MIFASDQIRELIKDNLDKDKIYFWDTPLWKTNAIKDIQFYIPTNIEEIKNDFENAKIKIAEYFGILVQEVKNLASNPETIYDCDNMARELRTKINDMHYKRYRNGLHKFPYEYAIFQVTDMRQVPFLGRLKHDYCMIFTEKEKICFADLMQDHVWPITEFKPNIINIGG